MNRLVTHTVALSIGFLVGLACRRNDRPKTADTPDCQELERQIDAACAHVTATMQREGQSDEATAFAAAQVAWRAYRDAEVLAVYPSNAEMTEVAKLRRNDLRTALAQERLRQLRGWWD